MEPWIWWTIAAVLLGLELLVTTTFLVPPAAAALVVGLVALFLPWLGWQVETAIFAILALVGSFAWRRYGYRPPKDQPRLDLQNRTNLLVGRRVTTQAGWSNCVGPVAVDDTVWRARLEAASGDPAVGTVVEVTACEGSLLVVRRVA